MVTRQAIEEEDEEATEDYVEPSVTLSAAGGEGAPGVLPNMQDSSGISFLSRCKFGLKMGVGKVKKSLHLGQNPVAQATSPGAHCTTAMERLPFSSETYSADAMQTPPTHLKAKHHQLS